MAAKVLVGLAALAVMMLVSVNGKAQIEPTPFPFDKELVRDPTNFQICANAKGFLARDNPPTIYPDNNAINLETDVKYLVSVPTLQCDGIAAVDVSNKQLALATSENFRGYDLPNHIDLTSPVLSLEAATNYDYSDYILSALQYTKTNSDDGDLKLDISIGDSVSDSQKSKSYELASEGLFAVGQSGNFVAFIAKVKVDDEGQLEKDALDVDGLCPRACRQSLAVSIVTVNNSGISPLLYDRVLIEVNGSGVIQQLVTFIQNDQDYLGVWTDCGVTVAAIDLDSSNGNALKAARTVYYAKIDAKLCPISAQLSYFDGTGSTRPQNVATLSNAGDGILRQILWEQPRKYDELCVPEAIPSGKQSSDVLVLTENAKWALAQVSPNGLYDGTLYYEYVVLFPSKSDEVSLILESFDYEDDARY